MSLKAPESQGLLQAVNLTSLENYGFLQVVNLKARELGIFAGREPDIARKLGIFATQIGWVDSRRFHCGTPCDMIQGQFFSAMI